MYEKNNQIFSILFDLMHEEFQFVNPSLTDSDIMQEENTSLTMVMFPYGA